jgi:predicted nucleic-acid-binding protein
LRALRRFEAGRAGFADALIVERAIDEGCAALVTFDRALHGERDVRAP